MPKNENQKKKLLALREIFLEQTNENHYLTMSDIMRHLKRYNISAERKSIYDDFEILREFGIDIESKREGSMTSYHIANRLFDLRELKMLVDFVQSSKFITKIQTKELTNKIKTLCSKHDSSQLEREVIMSRAKSTNDTVLNNIDKIHIAMNSKSQISFVYYNYSIQNERVLRRTRRYNTSPYALILFDGYYYMLAYNKYPKSKTYHYRVDRMGRIIIADRPREDAEWFKNHNKEQYTKLLFSMFDGNEEEVTIHFAMKHAGAVIDRFGKEVTMKKVDNDWFEVTARIKVSPPFYAQVLSFGAEARVVAPEEAVKEIRKHLGNTLKGYTYQNINYEFVILSSTYSNGGWNINSMIYYTNQSRQGFITIWLSQLTLPDDDYLPSQITQSLIILPVPIVICREFFVPDFLVSFRPNKVLAFGVSMPEAAIHEYTCFIFW